jgi:hypothetical protein
MSIKVLEKLDDPSYLPTRDDFRGPFARFAEDRGLANEAIAKEYSKWRELFWNYQKPIFEIWTKEYIEALGNYLAERVSALGGTKEEPTIILEVGAGNGRLTHFLNQKLQSATDGRVKVVACDSGEWRIEQAFPVEKLSHSEALVKYKPKVVIFSWIPPGDDYTDAFRATPSVQEYLLIGEADIGCCGEYWPTWGVSQEEWDENSDTLFDPHEGELPPYEADGFSKEYLDTLSKLQLSRGNVSEGRCKSQTVSFKRK